MTVTPVLTRRQRQSQATQTRLLDAAFEEFQQYGLAGARVDRIAEQAKANKRLIYVYFGDKEQLFDTVIVRRLEAMIQAHDVPFTAEHVDLPSYAAELFDYLEDRPGVQRLFLWRNLERIETSEVEHAAYREKVAHVAAAQRDGRLDASLPPAHVFALLLATVQSWAIASPALRAAAGRDAARKRRRESVRHAVSRISPASAR